VTAADSVAAAISEAPDAMSLASRSWLENRITALHRQWSALDFPRAAGLIHGDAHIGNLMRAASGQAVLGDWDHVATGPRECRRHRCRSRACASRQRRGWRLAFRCGWARDSGHCPCTSRAPGATGRRT
jgi:Phosphotransferase enzyme family